MKLLLGAFVMTTIWVSAPSFADGWECRGDGVTALLYDRRSTGDNRIPAHLTVHQKGVRTISVSNERATAAGEIKFTGITKENKPEDWPKNWNKPGSSYSAKDKDIEYEGKGDLQAVELRINGNPFSPADKTLVYKSDRVGQVLLTYASKTTQLDVTCSRYTVEGRQLEKD